MALKTDAKFEEKLISCLKNGKNLENFDSSHRESQKFSHLLVFIVKSI